MEIDINFIKKLNSNDFLPEKGLRRNSIYYNLIANTNCIIGLLLSENLDSIAIFLRREEQYIQEIQKTHKHLYLELCKEFVENIKKKYSNINYESDIYRLKGEKPHPSQPNGCDNR